MEDKVEVEVLTTPFDYRCISRPDWVTVPANDPFYVFGYNSILGGEFNKNKLVNLSFFEVIGDLVGLDGNIDFLLKYNKNQLRTANYIRQHIEEAFSARA